MLTIGTARVIEDGELRFSTAGKAILKIKLAFNYGKKKEGEAYSPSQFVNGMVFNEFAESLAPKVKKGRIAYVELKDVHNEIWTDKQGKDHVDMSGFVQSCQMLTWPEDDEKPKANAPRSAPRAASGAAPKSATGTGFDDMDDDIPFASALMEHDPIGGHRKGVRARGAR